MRIVYIGVVEFSYYCLRIVLSNNAEVVGIVTVKESNFNSDFKDLTPIAVEYNIPIHYTKNVNDSYTINWIREIKPDIIFCWGISQLIKSELLSLAPMGILGVHPTLLPRNRGRNPLIWALALGLKESGLTFFFMDEGADSGDILSQVKFPIYENDDASTLYSRVKELAELQISEFLPKLISGTFTTYKQDNSIASYWRKRFREDGLIDWRMSTGAILNLIRALVNPYPGAEFIYKEKCIKVWKAKRYEENIDCNIEPGKVLHKISGMPVVKTYDGAVVLVEYEPNIEFSIDEYIK